MVMEGGGRMGEFGKIVNEAHCSVLDTLQWFSPRGWESSQEGVAVVQVGDDKGLDQELLCLLWWKNGSCGCCRGQICRIGLQQWCWGRRTVHRLGLRPGSSRPSKMITWHPQHWLMGPCEGSLSWDEEEVSFTKVEFEVMKSCPSGDVCQTFQDVRPSVGVGGGWGKERHSWVSSA